jgi:2,3-dihydroxyphenylpropionate 1,2-dioxygenase
MERVRRLGELVGSVLAETSERVLVLGSGGLSHDPPVPKLETASGAQLEMILRGRDLSPEQRSARQQRVVDGAKAFTAGTATIQDLNPAWDRAFLDVCAAGDTSVFDRMEPAEMAAAAGNSAHEVRTWVAALSAVRATGPYRVTSSYYRAVKELIAGFGVITVDVA